jgi:hypothetical protein
MFDLTKFSQYINALVSSTILPSFKGFFSSSSKEISSKLENIEQALKERTDIDEVLSHVESLKGEKGDTPTDEELLALIRPLIPEPIKGDDGHTPTDDELLALIKPLIVKPKDGKTPTKAELRELIKPLIPAPKNGKDGMPGRDGVDGKDSSPDTPNQIVKKLESLEGDMRLDASAIRNLPVMERVKGLFGKAVKSLSNLSDVNITSPADNQSLTYDAATGKWVNETVAGGTGHTIQDEGISLTARTNLNFVGAGVTVTDGGAGPNSTIVTIGGGAGSGITRTVVVTAGSFTAGSTASTDYVYLHAGAHNATLPTANANSNRYTFRNNHSAAVTVTRAGADTISYYTTGNTSITLNPLDSVDLISNGTDTWSVI